MADAWAPLWTLAGTFLGGCIGYVTQRQSVADSRKLQNRTIIEERRKWATEQRLGDYKELMPKILSLLEHVRSVEDGFASAENNETNVMLLSHWKQELLRRMAEIVSMALLVDTAWTSEWNSDLKSLARFPAHDVTVMTREDYTKLHSLISVMSVECGLRYNQLVEQRAAGTDLPEDLL